MRNLILVLLAAVAAFLIDHHNLLRSLPIQRSSRSNALTIKVSGLHTQHFPPERCVVKLTIEHETKDKLEAYEAVSRATREIAAYLKTIGPQAEALKPAHNDAELFERYKHELLADLSPSHRIQFDSLSPADQEKWLSKRIQDRLDREQVSTEQTAHHDTNVNSVENWHISSLQTSTWTPWYDRHGGQEEPSNLFRTSAKVSITFKEFKDLSKICLHLATMQYVFIDSLDYRLTDETRSRLQQRARAEAFKQAAEKAKDYASASSTSVFKPEYLIHKTAEDLSDSKSNGNWECEHPVVRRANGGGDMEPIELHPKEVPIEAGVSCTFEYLP